MFEFAQLSAWFVLFLLLNASIKYRYFNFLSSLMGSFFILPEFISVYLTGNLVDYRFFTHLTIHAIESFGFQFKVPIIIFSIIFILIFFLLLFTSSKLHYFFSNKVKTFLLLIFTLLVFLGVPGGIFSEFYDIYKIVGAEVKGLTESLQDLGINPEKYITPSKLEALAGKNIIVISLESLEQGFLGKHFDNITPNLTKLSKQWTYFNKMPESPGASWTAGSLYSCHVGIPAFFKGHGNDFFQGITEVKLAGLGHVLKKSGYQSKYLMGNVEFAGTLDLLTAYNIPAISEKNSVGKYSEVEWGMYDFDLFEEAKIQLKAFKKNKPFALFLSTVGTHAPNGIYDKRMEKYLSKKKTDLQFSVSTVDYLINDFIEHLKKENLLNNTAIFIYPDHKFMGVNTSEVTKLQRSYRQLYLITNVPESDLKQKVTDTLYQIQIPRLVINGAQIKTNANFLVDFIKNKNISQFIENNKPKISTLNTASPTRRSFKTGIKVRIVANKLIISSLEKSITSAISKDTQEKIYDITLNADISIIKSRIVLLKRVFLMEKEDFLYNRLHLIIQVKLGVLKEVYLGNKRHGGLYKKGKEVNYSKEEIHSLISPTLINKIKNYILA